MKRFHINLDDSAFTKERIPPKSQFQSKQNTSSPSTSTTEPIAKCSVQPLSYAEYIVQSKGTAAAAPQRNVAPKQPMAGGAGVCSLQPKEPESVSSSTGGSEKTQDCDKRTEVQLEEGKKNKDKLEPSERSCHKSDPSLIQGPKPVGSGSSIIVSPRQRGNPILKFVRSVPWEFGEVAPDYILGQTTCALFLSLRYHNLNPNYIHDRLKQLGNAFTLRVLLVQVDVKDPHHALKELARICIMADCTLILAWSPEEAGRYLETYKSYEKKPADLLKEQVEKNYLSKVTDCLTTVKSVNKTDAITLLSTFSSVKGIIDASKEDLVLCPGLGPQKARRLYDVLHKPFLKSKTSNS
ncbi:PREDICTED: DNA excision repair protein ERCC-1 [Cyprinodon variegatus]|uniref:DNA excision repair protein ERCC-1 n=1 Tax=Cyprinodon variegatus TaxID=28743 RepID=A0A3Q2DC09_CYPVA|nr:PREDICTED: DNA excision repair protein ERCC-1 [Cyprinodon variegatus]